MLKFFDEDSTDLVRRADAAALACAMHQYRIAGHGWRTQALRRLQAEMLRQLRRGAGEAVH